MNILGISPLEWHWYFWAVVVGIACTIPCALLGCHLVLRRLSLLGDAISHGVLPGIVIGVLLSGQLSGWPIVLGAIAFGLLTAFLTQALHSVADVPEDASMGVVFTGLFALGVVLVSLKIFRGVDLDASCVLYGIFQAIPNNTTRLFGLAIPIPLFTMVPVLFVTVLFVVVFWKELKISSFDPGLATTVGVNANLIHYLLMAMVAMVTVTAFEAVGSVLVVAMFIVPAACAQLLTDRLSLMMALAALIAVLATIGGVVLSGPAALDTNTPGMIAVVAGALFALAVFFAPQHGLVSAFVRKARLGLRVRREDILATLFRQSEVLASGNSEIPERLSRDLARARRGWVGRLALFSLRRDSLLQEHDGHLQLTDTGKKLAERLVRSHRLWETFLGRHFALPLDHLHDPAERMEHFIGPELQQKLAAELQEPGVDPHGRAIPTSPPSEP